MAQATCRVTPALEKALCDAAAEVSLFKSDVIRRALVYYIKTNPDRLQAFTDLDVPGGVRTIASDGGNLEASENDRSSRSTGSVYDPMGDV